jgi:histidine triad (HIT) family protein
MDDCIFCKMVAGEVPVTRLYEDDDVLAFLDIGPLSDGHALVIPKQHFVRVHECDPKVLAAVGGRLPSIAGAVAEAVEADGYNVLCNNGSAAGQAVDHLHFHVIPRKKGDGVFTQWPAKKYPPGRIEEIAARIRGNLND